MNFTVGERRKTRSGCDVEILKIDAPGRYPIVGLIYFTDGTTAPDEWTKDGSSLPSGKHPLDLMPLTRDVWVKLYRRGDGATVTSGIAYASEEEARGKSGEGHGYIGTFKIEGVPE